MTRPWILAATIALGIGCSRPAAPPPRASRPDAGPSRTEADLPNNVAAALAGVLQRAGTPVVVEGSSLHVGRRTLRAHASVREVVSDPDHTTAAVDVTLDLDGVAVDAFRTLAIAIDANREEAVQRAVREWSVAYGMPIADAIRGATPEGGLLQLGPFTVYPGPTGARGEMPTNWERGTSAMHRSFLDRIAPSLDALIPPNTRARFHSLKFTMHVRNASAGEGECLVDGAPSDALCQIVRTYPWPQGPEEYLFKQFYVLAPHE
jgi:hypothetical protein